MSVDFQACFESGAYKTFDMRYTTFNLAMRSTIKSMA